MIVFAKEIADHDDISNVMLMYVMYAVSKKNTTNAGPSQKDKENSASNR